MKKNCIHCNVNFEDGSKNGIAKFCSIRCRSAHKRPQYEKWKAENKEHFDKYQGEYYKHHKDRRIAQTKTRMEENKEHYRKWYRERHKRLSKENILYKHVRSVRSRLSKFLKGKRRSGFGIDAIGCSESELRTHLESKFQLGMTWENYGEWHIDHIVPLSSFDLTNPEQVKQACHYTNLQPLWAKDNLSKGNKIGKKIQGSLSTP